MARAIFSIFFAHSLFSKIEKAANKTSGNISKKLSAAAIIYIIAEIAFSVIDELHMMALLNLALTVLIIGILSLSMCQAQAQANSASLDVNGLQNSRLTAANYIWIAVGIILWLLIIIGTLTPDIV